MRRCYLVVFVFALTGLISACGSGSDSGATVASNHQSSRQSKQADRQLRKEEKKTRKVERKRHRRIAKEERIEAKEQRQARGEREAKKTTQEAGPSGVDPIAAEEFHYFSETDLSNWEIAYGICAVTPEAQLAREFHTSQNWADIGHAYGQDYREPFNVAAEEGCMVALKDTEAQREAAFKMMEAAEK